MNSQALQSVNVKDWKQNWMMVLVHRITEELVEGSPVVRMVGHCGDASIIVIEDSWICIWWYDERGDIAPREMEYFLLADPHCIEKARDLWRSLRGWMWK